MLWCSSSSCSSKFSALAGLVISVILVNIFGSSDGAWCICRQDVSQSALQKTLDYACGAGADCGSILQTGTCYQPNTVVTHCSYAANSYYQRKGQTQQACDFSGTAILTNTDPSPGNGCTYPATPGSAGNGSSVTPIGTPGSSSTTPSTFPPPTGAGAIVPGLGPSAGVGLPSTDGNTGFIPKARLDFLLLTIFVTSILVLREF